MGWIAVDLDGTLAYYDEWRGLEHIGEPVPAMVALVQEHLKNGDEIRIFTARVSREYSKLEDRSEMSIADIRKVIEDWCERHIGVKLPITCVKDFEMRFLYDDRCIQVEINTGRLVGRD